MLRIVCALAATAAAAAAALAISIALPLTAAAAPPAGAPSPTPFPPDTAPVTIRVIHDLNNDGVAQPDEPGIEGIGANAGCGDALLQLPDTDADGTIETIIVPPIGDRAVECYRVERPFGWLPTSPVSVRVDVPVGEPTVVTFLLHDLGSDAMEIFGEVIVAGLPARDPVLGLGPPYEHCAESFIEFSNASLTQAILFVVAPSQRDGCPGAGSEVTVLVNSIAASTMPVQPGQRVPEPLAVGGDSMRLYGTGLDAARIDGVECGVVVPVTGGFTPSDFVRVFVLSAELRAGCGTPGAPVRFFRDGAPLDPLVPWQAGQLDSPPEFTPFVPLPTAITRDLIPPETGAGAPLGTGTRYAWLVAAIACTGIALAASAILLGRPRRM